MINFSFDENHGDIMVLVVMSHGDEGGHSGKVLTSNGERIDIEHDIFRYVRQIDSVKDFITKSNVKF